PRGSVGFLNTKARRAVLVSCMASSDCLMIACISFHFQMCGTPAGDGSMTSWPLAFLRAFCGRLASTCHWPRRLYAAMRDSNACMPGSDCGAVIGRFLRRPIAIGTLIIENATWRADGRSRRRAALPAAPNNCMSAILTLSTRRKLMENPRLRGLSGVPEWRPQLEKSALEQRLRRYARPLGSDFICARRTARLRATLM